jgi:GTP cyclohydrolase I
MTSGLNDDPLEPLSTTFPCDHDDIVLIKDISFVSVCEHHLLPFSGVVHVAYIPNGRVVGLSKIPRAVDILAARPQIQERLTQQIGGAVKQALDPAGVAVVIQAEHGCMSCRGVMKPGSTTITSSMTGLFRDDPSARAEIMALIK